MLSNLGVFKTSVTAAALIGITVLAGCGTQPNSPNPTTAPTNTTNATSTSTNSTSQATSTNNDSSVPKAYLYLTVVGSGVKLGSDGKTHDTFLPGNFTLEKGVPTEITIANYDEGPHTLTAPDLNINIQIPGHKAEGVPSITTTVVTVDKTGTFIWQCMDPCDSKAGGWAMAQDGYMKGKITVVDDNKQYEYMTVVGSGVKLGSDGKTHDTFLPGNITFQKDKPVVLEVANYDEGPHTFTVPDLGLNLQIPGHKADGVASVTTFTFTPTKAGTFKWQCMDPCDAKASGWAMSQSGYMQGEVTVQ